MRVPSRLRPFATRLTRTRARLTPRRPAFRPRVEGLEGRCIPSVTSVTDNGVDYSTPVGPWLYFVGDDPVSGLHGVWRTDGHDVTVPIDSGGEPLMDRFTSDFDNRTAPPLVAAGDYVYFFTADGGDQYTLWRNDSRTGTSEALQVVVGADDYRTPPEALTAVGQDVYFMFDAPAAVTPDHQDWGYELWKFNSATGVTAPYKDVLPGPEGAYPLLAAAGTHLYYTDSQAHLWGVTDLGTGAATAVLGLPGNNQGVSLYPATGYWDTGNFGNYLTVGSDLYLLGVAGTEGGANGVWRITSPTAVAEHIMDLDSPIVPPNYGYAFTAAGSALYFVDQSSAAGNPFRLWKLEGSTVTLLKSGLFTNPLGQLSDYAYGVTDLAVVGPDVYYTGINWRGFINHTYGDGVWKYDGTTGDITPIATFPDLEIDPALICTAGSTLYYSGGAAGGVWQTDGTPATTFSVPDVPAVYGTNKGYQGVFTAVVNSTTYFSAGGSLWRANALLSHDGFQDALDSQPPVDPTTGDPTVTLQGNTQAQADAFVALFQAPGTPNFTPLQPPAGATTPIDVVVSFGPGVQLNEAALVIPQGIRVQINGGTWYGGSPALTFSSGDLTITGATFLNATDAPTILVTGGSLTLRNDTIQESTGSNDAALSVTGGTVDLGTASDPGGNTINVNGAGEFVHNTTPNPVAAAGDTFTVNGRPLTPSSLSGVVWEDFNNDGQVDFGEKGIGGVTITLTGTDFLGNAVNPPPQLTDSDGAYLFLNLLPGDYTLTETQPAGYLQGTDSAGTAGGSLAATDQFFVHLDPGVDGLNYNFGEQPPAGGSVQHGQTAGIGFWNNKNGQVLIKALNGGGVDGHGSHQLGDWLAATLPNIFGALAGKDNASVAALFQQDFLLKGVKLDAQVLATALSVYATNATLDPTQVAAQYGFTVSGDGAGTATFNVGSNGDAFGVANNTTMTVMDLLLATDEQAIDGVLYGGNATKRNEANSVFSAVNQAGGIG